LSLGGTSWEDGSYETRDTSHGRQQDFEKGRKFFFFGESDWILCRLASLPASLDFYGGKVEKVPVFTPRKFKRRKYNILHFCHTLLTLVMLQIRKVTILSLKFCPQDVSNKAPTYLLTTAG